jgi:hypothetical protein
MNWRRGTIGVVGAGLIAGCSVLPAAAQLPTGTDPTQARTTVSPGGHAMVPGSDSASPFETAMAAKTILARNVERQKRLESDTQRLLVLANELKTEVASSGTETMTPVMLRQMDEIEKLARSVKDRMRN